MKTINTRLSCENLARMGGFPDVLSGTRDSLSSLGPGHRHCTQNEGFLHKIAAGEHRCDIHFSP